MLIAPADSPLYWITIFVVTFALGVAAWRRWARRDPKRLRGALAVAAVALAGMVVGLLPSIMLWILTGCFDLDGIDPGYALWWSGAAVVGLASMALGAWAFVGDPSRGRRRCPKCWYDMAATPGTTCPECGKQPRAERAFFRTRRRWRWAALAGVLAALSTIGVLVPLGKEGRWAEWVPDVVLIAVFPWVGWSEDVNLEFESRFRDAHNLEDLRLTPEHDAPTWRGRFLIRRCIAALGSQNIAQVDTSLTVLASAGTHATKAVDRLVQLTEDPRPNFRAAAMPVLAAIPAAEAEAMRAIRAGLGDEDPSVRTAAVIAWRFGLSRSPEDRGDAPAELLAVAATDADPSIRQFAIRSLSRATPAAAVIELLETLSRDADGGLRRESLVSLSRIDPGGLASVDALRRALADADARIRRNAVYWAVQLGPHTEELASSLVRLAADPEIDPETFNLSLTTGSYPPQWFVSTIDALLDIPRVRAAVLRAADYYAADAAPLLPKLRALEPLLTPTEREAWERAMRAIESAARDERADED